MKEKSFKEEIFSLREKLSQLEKDLRTERDKGREPSRLMALDMEAKEISKQIGIMESEERAAQRESLIEKVVSILGELQTKSLSQSDQWDRLRRLCGLANEIEKLIGVRKEWRRIDHVKVLIKEESWRQRRLPSISSTVRFPELGMMALGAGNVPDPRSDKTEIYEFLQFEKAKKFESEGRVVIIDEASPQYQEQNILDPSPEILDIVIALDFGLPVPLNGLLSEFKAVEKEIGFFRLNFVCVQDFIRSQKQAAKKK